MQLNVSPSAHPDWNEYLKNLDCNIYHSSEWAQSNHSDHEQPLFFRWLEGEQCIGVGVGVERWSHLPVVGNLIKHLNFESYPAVKDNSPRLLAEVLEQLKGHAKKKGYLSVSVNSFLAGAELQNCEKIGYRPTRRIEFAIDLQKTDDELFKNMATRHKRKVKKAYKCNLKFQEAATMEAMREFRRLQVQSRDRRMKKGEFIGMMDDSYYEHLAKSYFREKLGRVFLITHEGQAVSAAFVSIYAGKGYYVYGGSSDAGFRMNAPPLLFLNIFSRCRELGCSEFNMGGVPASSTDPEEQSHGLYMFKAGFGGEEIHCANLLADNLQPVKGSLVKFIKKIR